MSVGTVDPTVFDTLGQRAKLTSTGGGKPRAGRYRPMIPLAALMALACYAFLFFYVRPHIFRGNSDFAFYYRAGKMLKAGYGANVYDLNAERAYDAKWGGEYTAPGRNFSSYPFVASPFILLIFGPLACLSYSHAWTVWYAANVSMLLGIPFLLRSVLGHGRLFALALLSPPFFLPLDFALFQGQPTILLALLFAWMFTEIVRERAWHAGCILALVTIKPQLAIPMLLALAFARNWKAIAAFFGASFGLFWVSAALVGWRTAIRFPLVLRQFSQLPLGLGGPDLRLMPNVRGILYGVLHSRISTNSLEALTIVLSLALMMAVWVSLRKRESLTLGFALVIVVTLLTSYYGYMHDMSLLLVSFLLTGSYLRGRKLGPVEVTLAFAVYALFLLPAVSVSFHMMVIGVFLGMLLLTGLQFTRLLRRSSCVAPELRSSAPVLKG